MARRFDAVNEQVVLSSMFAKKNFLDAGLSALDAGDFLGEWHGVIFAAIIRCLENGFELSPKNLAYHSNGAKFGGIEFLEKFFSGKAVAANEREFDYHLRMMRQDSARAKVARKSRSIDEAMLDKTRSFGDCEKLISDLSQELRSASGVILPGEGEAMDSWLQDYERMRSGERRVFVSTGVECMDKLMTEGFAKGGLTIFAGRPRMGKTILWTDLIRRALFQPERPRLLVIPFEKGRQYFLNMLVSSVSKVDLDAIVKYTDQLTEDEDARVRKAVEIISRRMKDRRLVIMDSPVMRMVQDDSWSNRKALDEVEKIIASGKFDIAFFDLFERLLATSLEAQKISLALIRLQTLCPKYGLHMVLTQQLSRRAEDMRAPGATNGKKRPTLVDLKNSGGYEEIADHVFLIHREKVFKRMLRADTMECHLAKQKSGDLGETVLVDFLPKVCRVSNDRILSSSSDLQKFGDDS
jgi:replicative DNA helicase